MAAVFEKQSFTDTEIKEWLESLDYVLQTEGPERARQILEHLQIEAQKKGVPVPYSATTPYINTISLEQQIPLKAAVKLKGASKASTVGMPWPWLCAPTGKKMALVAIFLRTHRLRHSMK